MTIGLTPYITPQMLLSSNYGISWDTFPKPGSSVPDQISAQLDICWAVTSEMDTIASLTMRATLNTESEFGPDFAITVLPNGWTRFRLSNWPILQLTGAQASPSGITPPAWTNIPLSALQTEHATSTLTGSTVPSAAEPGPTAALIAPGYVGWGNGRKGYLVQVSSVNGFPSAGIDVDAHVGDLLVHVDDVTGWSGAHGTIYDSPYREPVHCVSTTVDVGPDQGLANTGPGNLLLDTTLRFNHLPQVGVPGQADQRVLINSMPMAVLQAGFYLATYFGLIRGATGAIVQSSRGQAAPSGMKGANSWYEMAEKTLSHYARVF